MKPTPTPIKVKIGYYLTRDKQIVEILDPRLVKKDGIFEDVILGDYINTNNNWYGFRDGRFLPSGKKHINDLVLEISPHDAINKYPEYFI